MGTINNGLGFDLSGRVALVTGAARGIGRALAIGLAKAGADIAITDLKECLPGAEETAQEVVKQGKRAFVSPIDVTSFSAIELGAASVIEQFGRIDTLINNAGVIVRKPAFEFSEEDWDRVLAVNLRGVFFCSQIVGRHMAGRNGGKIVNISSINGIVGMKERASYCASKAGIVSLTKVLAHEWAEYNITVNAVAPTFIVTPLTEPLFQNEGFRQEVFQHQAIKRPGQPEDIVGAVAFLASDAASLITGAILPIDAGWTAV
jgi:2-dehydro-3-deoxy-D-gluconate 5-dehydrogenase